MRGSGQERRLRYYLDRYREAFGEVAFFSYAKEHEDLGDGTRLVPKKVPLPGTLYSLALPLVGRRELTRCRLLRVLQMSAATPAALIKRLYGIPYAVTFGYDAVHFAKKGAGERLWLSRWNLELACRTADVIFYATPSLRERLEKLRPRGAIHQLSNGVDLDLFRQARARMVPDERWKIISVGRLAPQKDFPRLIDAMEDLAAVELQLVGAGPDAEALEARARERG